MGQNKLTYYNYITFTLIFIHPIHENVHQIEIALRTKT